MNRVNKYRGMHNDEWVYGYYAVIGKRSVIIKSNSESYYSVGENLRKRSGNEIVDVKADTVGQYIGVDDKNGKEIYEDDIVLSDDGKVGQVQWFEEHLAFMIWCVTDNKVYFAYDNDFSKIEVIGNLYENADLLKEVEISE